MFFGAMRSSFSIRGHVPEKVDFERLARSILRLDQNEHAVLFWVLILSQRGIESTCEGWSRDQIFGHDSGWLKLKKNTIISRF
jgi:hypothetical protein